MNDLHFKTAIAFSTKADGSMKKFDGSIDFKNLQKFLFLKKMPQDIVAMEQVHDGSLGIVGDNSPSFVHGVDALITNKKKLTLAVVTADCLPIIIYDTHARAIGAIHAGSKGLLHRIISHTIKKFTATFNSKPEDISVTIGPSIEASCYEVGHEFIRQFEQTLSWFGESFYTKANDRYFLDLKKIALQSLRKEGILKEHISVVDVCTKCSVDSLYSYRRGDKTERFVSIISIV